MNTNIFPTYQFYDEIVNDNNVSCDTMTVCGGKTEKVFVRMDSTYLSDLFKSKSKGRDSYVTYLDKLFNKYSFTRQGPPLSKVSVLLKSYASSKGEGYACGEEIGSKIANILGIPTVYNKYIEGVDTTPNREFDDINSAYTHHVVSVDFMEYNKDISYDTFYEGYCDSKAGRYSRREWRLREWYEFFLLSHDILEQSTKQDLTMDVRKKLAIDFIPMYLFRKYGIFDSDFDIHNIIVKHSKSKGDYSIGPNFDMERAFFKRHNVEALCRAFKVDLEFAYMHAPNKVKSFVKNFVNNQNALLSLAKSTPSVFYRDKYVSMMSAYYPALCDVIKSIDFSTLKTTRPKGADCLNMV